MPNNKTKLDNSKRFQDHLKGKFHTDQIAKIKTCIENCVNQDDNKAIKDCLEECLKGILSESTAEKETVRILGFVGIG